MSGRLGGPASAALLIVFERSGACARTHRPPPDEHHQDFGDRSCPHRGWRADRPGKRRLDVGDWMIGC